MSKMAYSNPTSTPLYFDAFLVMYIGFQYNMESHIKQATLLHV
jgi:hypothetical protein